MEARGSQGHLYRLVVARSNREVVVETLPFRSRKAATARVADAIRRAARDGTVCGVILQYRPAPPNGFRDEHWTAAESWGPTVVNRVLRQASGGGPRTADPPSACTVPPRVVVPPPTGGNGRRAGHRRHVMVAVGLAAVAWIAAAALLAGGHLGGLWRTASGDRGATVTELPFAAPSMGARNAGRNGPEPPGGAPRRGVPDGIGNWRRNLSPGSPLQK